MLCQPATWQLQLGSCPLLPLLPSCGSHPLHMPQSGEKLLLQFCVNSKGVKNNSTHSHLMKGFRSPPFYQYIGSFFQKFTLSPSPFWFWVTYLMLPAKRIISTSCSAATYDMDACPLD